MRKGCAIHIYTHFSKRLEDKRQHVGRGLTVSNKDSGKQAARRTASRTQGLLNTSLRVQSTKTISFLHLLQGSKFLRVAPQQSPQQPEVERGGVYAGVTSEKNCSLQLSDQATSCWGNLSLTKRKQFIASYRQSCSDTETSTMPSTLHFLLLCWRGSVASLLKGSEQWRKQMGMQRVGRLTSNSSVLRQIRCELITNPSHTQKKPSS